VEKEQKGTFFHIRTFMFWKFRRGFVRPLFGCCSDVVRIRPPFSEQHPNKYRTNTEQNPQNSLTTREILERREKGVDRNAVIVAKMKNGDGKVVRNLEMVPDFEQQRAGVFGAFPGVLHHVFGTE
jgi:hypothetical protein